MGSIRPSNSNVKENKPSGKHFYVKNNKVGIFVTLKDEFVCKLQK